MRPSPGVTATLDGGGAESPLLPQAASAAAMMMAAVRRRVGWCMDSRRRIGRVYDSFGPPLADGGSGDALEDAAPLRLGDRSDRQAVATLEHDHVGQGRVGAHFGQAEQFGATQGLHLEHEPAWRSRIALRIVVGGFGVELCRVGLRRRGDLGNPGDTRWRAMRVMVQYIVPRMHRGAQQIRLLLVR